MSAASLAMRLPAHAAALPIVLYVDLSVDPAKEKDFLNAYHTHFKPVARKQEGYVDLTIAKIDKVMQGAGPAKGVNYRSSSLGRAKSCGRNGWPRQTMSPTGHSWKRH